MKTIFGIALVALHAIALPFLLTRCRKDDLEVHLRGAPASARFDLDGDATGGATVVRDPDGPGLKRVRWTVDYRGGFEREVDAAQLVGPFQDPAHPPCGIRLVVGQAFLDEEVTPQVKTAIEQQLAGFEQWPLGKFQKVTAVDVRWARFDDAPGDAKVFGELGGEAVPALARTWHTDGYARVHVAVALDRVNADVVVALVPKVSDERLAFQIYAHASVSTGNGVADFALRTFHADAYATDAVRGRIDDAVIQAFDAPPPLDLGGGRSLKVGYCAGAELAVKSGAWAALPLAFQFDGGAILPPRFGPVPPPEPAPGVKLGFDLDLDTINALFTQLWRTGFLDEQLSGLEARFDDDPTVQALLSLRISPLTLALPPVVAPGPRGLAMTADLRVSLTDRGAVTPARVFGALDLDLAGTQSVSVADLSLACEPTPNVLRPCYGDLVAAMRDRAGDARDELTATLRRILDQLFAGARVTAPETPVTLVLDSPAITSYPGGVHLDLPAHLLGS